MPLSEKMAHHFIDPVIQLFFEVLYLLPEKDAQAAFSALGQLSMMKPHETCYPPLPSLFQNEVYQTKDIQDALRELSEIMYNRQPQDMTLHAEGHISVNWGKFGLIYRHVIEEIKMIGGEETVVSRTYESRSRGGGSITAEDVHNYMRGKFSVAKLQVVALHETQKFIDLIKKDPSRKKEYELLFAKWASSAEEEMPEDMRKFLLSDRTFKQKMTDVLLAHSAGSNFNHDLFSMPYFLFDSEMSETLDFLSQKYFFRQGKQITLKVLNTPEYKSVREKLKAQAKDPDEHYSFDVISSFIKVAELQEKLNIVGSLMKEHYPDLARECERICKEFIQHLGGASQDQQKSLAKNDLFIINEFHKVINDLIEFNLFVRDFFANYFALDESVETGYRDRENLLKKIFYFAFEEDRFDIDDNWKNRISRANPEEKGVVTITTEHRNQVFLRALTLPVEKWTPAFYEIFNEIFTLLDNSEDPAVLREKIFSYPPDFIEDLRWLRDRYVSLSAGDQIRPQPRGSMFLFCYPKSGTRFSVRRVEIIASLTIKSIYKVDWPQLLGRPLQNLGDCLVRFYEKSKFDEAKAFLGLVKKDLYLKVKDADDLIYFATYTKNSVLDCFIKIIYDKIPKLIKKSSDFLKLFEQLNSGQKNLIFSKLLSSNSFQGLISNHDDLISVLSPLSRTQRNSVLRVINLQDIIKSNSQFLSILKGLDLEGRSIFLNGLKNKFREWIKSEEDFDALFKAILPDEMSVFVEATKSVLPQFIASVYQFDKIFMSLAPCLRDQFYEAMKDKLWKPKTLSSSSFIWTENELCLVLRHLSVAQINEVCGHLKSKFEMIDSIYKLNESVRNYLDGAQKAALFEHLKDMFSKHPFFEHTMDSLLLTFPQQKKDICRLFHNRWESLIKTAAQLLKYMNEFEADQQPVFVGFLRFSLADIFQSPYKLSNFDQKQQALISSWALIGVLDSYTNKRLEDSNYSRLNKFAYSAGDKVAAAIQLKNIILQELSPEKKAENQPELYLEKKHVAALSSGELCKNIDAHFKRFRPEIDLKEFLQQRMQPAVEHKHDLR